MADESLNPEDFGYAQKLQEEELKKNEPGKLSKQQEILQRIYSANVPEPVFDQAKADRLKRMGRVNQMGNGLSVLGDMLATGLGANVKRRQEDGTAARLYQSYENNLDKYKNDKDVYSLRKMSKMLDDSRLELSEVRRDEQMDFQNRKQEAWERAKQADSALDAAKWSATYDLNNSKSKESERHNKAMEDAAEIRANKTGTTNNANKPVTIRTKNNEYQLKQSDVDFYSSEMMSQSKEVKLKYPELYEEVPETKMAKNKFDEDVEIPTGRNILKLKPNITRTDLARVYKEEEEKKAAESNINQRRANTLGLNPDYGKPQAQPIQKAETTTTQPKATKNNYSTGGYY